MMSSTTELLHLVTSGEDTFGHNYPRLLTFLLRHSPLPPTGHAQTALQLDEGKSLKSFNFMLLKLEIYPPVTFGSWNSTVHCQCHPHIWYKSKKFIVNKSGEYLCNIGHRICTEAAANMQPQKLSRMSKIQCIRCHNSLSNKTPLGVHLQLWYIIQLVYFHKFAPNSTFGDVVTRHIRF